MHYAEFKLRSPEGTVSDFETPCAREMRTRLGKITATLEDKDGIQVRRQVNYTV